MLPLLLLPIPISGQSKGWYVSVPAHTYIYLVVHGDIDSLPSELALPPTSQLQVIAMFPHRTDSSSSRDLLRPSTYSNVLTYRHVHFGPKEGFLSYLSRFAEAELQLYCPSIELPQNNAGSGGGPVAVFGQHDCVGGKVVLGRACHGQYKGNLSISVRVDPYLLILY